MLTEDRIRTHSTQIPSNASELGVILQSQFISLACEDGSISFL